MGALLFTGCVDGTSPDDASRLFAMGFALQAAQGISANETEALGAALTWGFERLDLHRVEAVVAVENERSMRLLERLGFRAEGVLRDFLLQDGVYHDHRVYSLLRTEWSGC